MIELRWFLKAVPCDFDNEGVAILAKDTLILQYRDRPSDCVPGNIEPHWTDVPTVREP